MCIYRIDWEGRCIGALQFLHRRYEGSTNEDFERLTYISRYVTITFANIWHVEELKDLNKARERALDYLSHESRRPIAFIETILAGC